MTFRLEGYIIDTNGYDKVEMMESAIGLDIEKKPQRRELPFFESIPAEENTVKMYAFAGKIMIYNSERTRANKTGYNKHALLEMLTEFYKTKCWAFNFYGDKNQVSYILYEQGKRIDRFDYSIKGDVIVEPEGRNVFTEQSSASDLFRQVHLPVLKNILHLPNYDFEKLKATEFLKKDSDDVYAGSHWYFYKAYSKIFRELAKTLLEENRTSGYFLPSVLKHSETQKQLSEISKYAPFQKTNHVLLQTNPALFSEERLALDLQAIEWITRSKNTNPAFQFWKFLLYAECQHRYGDKTSIGDHYVANLEKARAFQQTRKERHVQFDKAFKEKSNKELRELDPENFVLSHMRKAVHGHLNKNDFETVIKFIQPELNTIKGEGQSVPDIDRAFFDLSEYKNEDLQIEINDLIELRKGYGIRRLPFDFELRLSLLQWTLELRKNALAKKRAIPKKPKPRAKNSGEKLLQFRNILLLVFAMLLLVIFLVFIF